MSLPPPRGAAAIWLRRVAIAVGVVIACGCGATLDADTRRGGLGREDGSERPGVPAPDPSGRLPATASPTHYAISLIVDPERDRFEGDVTIDLSVPAPTSAVVLHGRGLTILRADALVGGVPIPIEVDARPSSGATEPDELVLALARTIPAGSAQIRIAYSAPLKDQLTGLYRVRDGDAAYAFTQFQPVDARSAFPCFDEPSFKVPFDLRVTTTKGNIVVANTPETERVVAEDGRTVTFTFATTPPLPTYLVAFAIGPLEIKTAEGSPVPLRLVTTRGKSALGDLALAAAKDHLTLLSEYFGRPYPYRKLDLVAVPEFAFGAMENAGLATFREELLLLDPSRSSERSRRNMALAVAHEISHHWFGNLVSIEWWDDLWLNEGFATWMEVKIVDTWEPSMEARLESLASKAWVMRLDSLDSARPVRREVKGGGDAEEAFDAIVYDKGASVLAMLEQWLGPDTFREGVRAYVGQHEHRSARSKDLFDALSAASGRDVGRVASSFLDQPGVPLVEAELSCDESGKARVLLRQSRHRSAPGGAGGRAADPKWLVPVCVAAEGQTSGPTCTLLEGERGSIDLPGRSCPRWIYPNAQELGYYRFSLPAEGFRALGDARSSLDVASRAGVFEHAWALVQSGRLGADVLVELLSGLRRERHRVVFEQAIAVLRAMADSVVDEETRPAFEAFASGLLLPRAKELGFGPRQSDDDEARLLRRSLLGALSTVSTDPWLLAEAGRLAQSYLKDPTGIDPDIAAIALRISTRRGGQARYQELLRALSAARAPQHRVAALGALSSFADQELLESALDLVFDERVKKQDAFYLVSGASAWPEARPMVVTWLEERLPDLREQVPEVMLVRILDSLDTVCDAASRDRLRGPIKVALRGVDGAEHRIDQVVERAELCIAQREREGERLRAALQKHRR